MHDGVGSNSVDHGQLRALITRIERLEEEKRDLAGDIKEVYAEAKAMGFDTKMMKKAVALRRIDENKRLEQEAILELYMNALGSLAETPLGRSALKRDFPQVAA